MSAHATHSGTCQVCGATQAVLRDVIVRHGWTTRWGAFDGTCTGSGAAPYEVSTSLIAGAMNDAVQLAEQCLRDGNTIRWTPLGAKVWVATGSPRPRWHEVDVLPLTKDGRQIWGYFDGETVVELTHRSRPLAEVISVGAMNYVGHLTKRATELRIYAQWQKVRLEHWKPSPLQPRVVRTRKAVA